MGGGAGKSGVVAGGKAQTPRWASVSVGLGITSGRRSASASQPSAPGVAIALWLGDGAMGAAAGDGAGKSPVGDVDSIGFALEAEPLSGVMGVAAGLEAGDAAGVGVGTTVCSVEQTLSLTQVGVSCGQRSRTISTLPGAIAKPVVKSVAKFVAKSGGAGVSGLGDAVGLPSSVGREGCKISPEESPGEPSAARPIKMNAPG